MAAPVGGRGPGTSRIGQGAERDRARGRAPPPHQPPHVYVCPGHGENLVVRLWPAVPPLPVRSRLPAVPSSFHRATASSYINPPPVSSRRRSSADTRLSPRQSPPHPVRTRTPRAFA